MKKIIEHEKSWRKKQKLRTKLMNIDSNMEKKKDMKKYHESTSTHIIKHIHNINTWITHIVMDISIYLCVYVCIIFCQIYSMSECCWFFLSNLFSKTSLNPFQLVFFWKKNRNLNQYVFASVEYFEKWISNSRLNSNRYPFRRNSAYDSFAVLTFH